MADYPSIPLEYASKRDAVSNRNVTIAGDGSFTIQDPATVETYVFTALHRWLESTDASILQAFWGTYRNDEFNLAWKDGVTYTAVFLEPPEIERVNATYYKARVRMAGRAP